MSGRRSRAKGARGDLEVRDLVRSVWPAAERGIEQCRSGTACADVEGTPYWIEVSRAERKTAEAKMRQAVSATDGRPPVVFRRKNRGEWLVTMRVDDFLGLALAVVAARSLYAVATRRRRGENGPAPADSRGRKP